MSNPRPSPTESATAYAVGIHKRGNDGQMYEVVQTKAGVKRWKAIKPSNRVYTVNTVHNYDVKFYIKLTTTSAPGTAEVYFKSNDVLWKRFAYKQVLIGRDPIERTKNVKKQSWFGGNSVLFKLAGDQWLFIGADIRSMTIKDTITKLVSTMGNNQVPYPYAIGKSLAYLLIEDVAVPKTELDPYAYYYSQEQKQSAIYAKQHKIPSKVVVSGPL